MSSPDRLVQATLNRLRVRIGQKLIDAAAELAIIAKDAPEKMRQEWDVFQEEVITEANRLEKESADEVSAKEKAPINNDIDPPQEKIHRIRSKVASANSKLEGKS
tara:strand:- start:77 stop:391 length:315 start_codon:yes stop_codon:yes gene_type:complete